MVDDLLPDVHVERGHVDPGKEAAVDVRAAATDHGVSLWAALCEPLSYGLDINKGTHAKLQGFRELIEGFIVDQADKNAYEIGTDIIRQSGIINSKTT